MLKCKSLRSELHIEKHVLRHAAFLARMLDKKHGRYLKFLKNLTERKIKDAIHGEIKSHKEFIENLRDAVRICGIYFSYGRYISEVLKINVFDCSICKKYFKEQDFFISEKFYKKLERFLHIQPDIIEDSYPLTKIDREFINKLAYEYYFSKVPELSIYSIIADILDRKIKHYKIIRNLNLRKICFKTKENSTILQTDMYIIVTSMNT